MRDQLNDLGKAKQPFLFMIDFEVKQAYISPINQLARSVWFSIDGFSNITTQPLVNYDISTQLQLKKKPLA